MTDKNNSVTISKRSFIISFAILLALMIIVGILTWVIPSGEYDRQIIDGRDAIVHDSFHYTNMERLPIYKWFTAPIEVLASDDGLIIIVIIVFLLFIGGSINILNHSNVLNAVIGKIVGRFGNRKYLLLAIMLLVFMSFGALIGMFEEVVPLIPIVIALCVCLGWDEFVGLGLTLLGAGFGFSAAVTNPFTIGVAQGLAQLPMFSGAWYRIIAFVLIYSTLLIFLLRYAKKIEKKNNTSLENQIAQYDKYTSDKKLNKAVRWFALTIFILIAMLITGSFVDGISDIAMPLVGVIFLIGGVGAGLFSGLGVKKAAKLFGKGLLDIAPAILLILMASSVKHIIYTAGVMDTILFNVANAINGKSPYLAVLLIFLVVFCLNFFIGSGSAKAFLIMPLIVPLAEIVGVNRQIMVLAFQFGDGFSNVLFPTNAVLLIGLGLASVSYTKWIKWFIKLELIITALCLVLLEVAVLIGYGPF